MAYSNYSRFHRFPFIKPPTCRYPSIHFDWLLGRGGGGGDTSFFFIGYKEYREGFLACHVQMFPSHTEWWRPMLPEFLGFLNRKYPASGRKGCIGITYNISCQKLVTCQKFVAGFRFVGGFVGDVLLFMDLGCRSIYFIWMSLWWLLFLFFCK